MYLLSPQAPPWRVEGLLYFYGREITEDITAFDRDKAVKSTKYLKHQFLPKQTQHSSISNIDWLMLFREIKDIFSENMKHK
jgi:hypothetical protein